MPSFFMLCGEKILWTLMWIYFMLAYLSQYLPNFTEDPESCSEPPLVLVSMALLWAPDPRPQNSEAAFAETALSPSEDFLERENLPLSRQ